MEINPSGQTVYVKSQDTETEPATDEPAENVPDAGNQLKTITFEETIQRLDEILKIEQTSRQKWELSALAKDTRRSPSLLLEIYEDWKNESQAFNPVDVHEFIQKNQQERQWLIAANVSCGTTIGLVADGGVGKSLLAYDICKAIATGQPWNGFRTMKSKVLIVQTDEPEIDTRERLDIAGFAESVEPGMVMIETNWQFSQIRKLEQWIDEHFQDGESGFVMIDSFTSANRSARNEEKDASYASVLYDLRDIANRKNVTFMILHHTNKGGGARGTTAFRNNVSEVWMLQKPDPKESELSPLHRILHIEKSRSGCSGMYQIKLNPDDYSWQHEGDFGQDENATLPLSARLLNYLELNRGIKHEPEELAVMHSMGGATKEAIRKQLERMRKKGLIEGEDRVKQRETGATRYKVYFAPKLSQPIVNSESDEQKEGVCPARLSSEDETLTGQEVCSLDKGKNVSNVSNEVVQRAKPASGKDLSLAGQDKSSLDTQILSSDVQRAKGASNKDSSLAGQNTLEIHDVFESDSQLSQGASKKQQYPDDFYGF